MSTLITSAVGGGKKAAPKAVARRRPPPAAPKPAAQVAIPDKEIDNGPAPLPEAQIETNASDALTLDSSSRRPEPAVPEPAETSSSSHVEAVTLATADEARESRPSGITPEEEAAKGSADQTAGSVPIADQTEPTVPSPAPQEPDAAQRSTQTRRTNKRRRADVSNVDTAQDDAGSRKAPRRKGKADTREAQQPQASVVAVPDAQQPEAGAESAAERGEDDAPGPSSKPAPKTRAKRGTTKTAPKTRKTTRKSTREASTTLNTTNEEESVTEVPSQASAGVEQEQDLQQDATRKRRGRKQNKPPPASEGARTEGEGHADEQNHDNEADEDNPEDHQIDPASLSMFALSRDKKHGKTSEREKKMADIDWDEVARKRREAVDNSIAENKSHGAPVVQQSTEGPDGTAESQPAVTPLPTAGGSGVKFRIVDNQIVVDETTTTIDRQAQAEAEAQISEPVEEETDLTTRINRTTWINDRRRDVADRVPMYKSKSDPWTYDQTEKLYEALAMFGTDYFTIAQMFPPKTRRQIKLKVQREEKIDPVRINAAFMGKHTRKEMNLEYYAQATGQDVSHFTKAGTLEEASSRIAEDMKDKEEAMKAAIAQEAENEKNREAFEKEQARARSSRKKAKKAQGGGTMGGVPANQPEEHFDDYADGDD